MVLNLIYRYKWLIGFAVVLSVTGAAAGVGIVGLIEREIASFTSSSEPIANSFGLFVLAIFAVVVFGVSSQYILSKLSASVVYDIRATIVKKLMGTSYERIEKIGGHRVYATLTDDVNSISNGFMLFPQFINSVSTVMLCFAYLIYSSWQLFLVIAAMIVVIVAVAYTLLRFGLINLKNLRELDDELFSGYKAMIDGGKEIGVNSARKAFVHDEILLPVFGRIKKMSVKVEVIFIVLSNWTASLILTVMGIIVFGSQYFLTGIPAEVVVAFMLVVFYLAGPIENLVDMVVEFGKALVAYRKIESLQLADADEYKAQQNTVTGSFDSWNSIRIKKVAYTYRADENNDDHRFSIGPLDLEINRGDTIFLIGGNGSGKSTFAKLLCGLYTPDTGGIYMDDVLVKKGTNCVDYRNQFSTIFSDFHLFDQVLDNEGGVADDKVVTKYLEKMLLSDKVSSENGVLSSTKLSQGQRKRLALILSYLESSSICIYDEWAADQDPHFRSLFYTSILPELKAQGKTLIIISHDDRYFHHCDRLIKLESGHLVDCDYSNSTLETPNLLFANAMSLS